MKKGQSPNAPGKKVDGLKRFSVEYGFSMEQIKAVAKTPDGAMAIDTNHKVDPPKFCRAFNGWQKNQAGEPETESEARTKKLNAETRAIEREELIENKVLQIESEVDAAVRHGLLMPVRDGLQGLQKKYHRFKDIQPDTAQKILENDLPALVELLRMAIEDEDLAEKMHVLANK